MSGSFSAFVPAGANSNIQFNSNGIFAGSDNLTWNNSTPVLSVKGIFNANGITVYSNTSLAAVVGSVVGDTGNNLICRQTAASGNVYYGTANASNTSGFVYFQTAGSNRAFITGAGLFGINTSSPGAQLGIESSSASTIGLIVKGASSQSANLQEWRNSSGTVLASINANGVVNAPQHSTTAQSLTTTGTTQTINWDSGSYVILTASSATNNITLTLNNPAITTYLIELVQGSTARNIIFPAGTLQAGGGGNTYTGTSNSRDLIAVTWNGSNYLINSVKNYA